MPQSKKSPKVKSEAKNGNGQNAKPEDRPIVRAIRITAPILEAAKKLKAEKGISFYRLGLEAISARLVNEGYLKDPAAKA
ncbi:MAG: hypothetical protein HYT79_02715 [Elusimicrobia bacterium]|nr:hypothetical protein [Elusimicrobiota bacterium]